MIVEDKIKLKINVEEELSDLQEKINSSKSHMERASLLLKKVRLLHLQELKEFVRGVNYKKIIEDLNDYIRSKKENV